MKPKPYKKKRLSRSQKKGLGRSRLIGSALVLLLCAITYLLWLPDVSRFQSANPSTTEIINARKRMGMGGKDYSITWTKLPKISPHLLRAVIVAEDGNFYSHRGVDIAELGAALQEAISEFEFPRGASTITQQLAKNLYLSESYNPLRKIKEVLIAKRLERQLGKKRILEIYLNIIEWGVGIFGISSASRHYFGITPNELSIEQSAFLAALIPNPLTRYNPTLNPGRVGRRKQLILRRM